MTFPPTNPSAASDIRTRTLARRTSLASAAGALALFRTGTARASDVYNCVNVVLRDPYWGQFRRTLDNGSNAAGIAPTLARAGFLVNASPSVGAIMWWPPHYFGASAFGHVGLVDAINADGSVLVRHENWPYGSPEWRQTFPRREGYRYIHRADAASSTDGTAAAEPGTAE